ncbi:hypothetical protein ElyMa_006027900 [Elysia marginata]|uniref:Uncharacterized protein n=1 Tax=Elysia marginata TaxID=1093978 RepID=A0AAV4GJE9_9GAST|nr:hypothetical protein ElyMa_006027900 [Elysia marginata]
MRTTIYSMLPCDGLRGFLLKEDKQKDEQADSEESDIDDTDGGETTTGKRKGGGGRKSGKSGATSGATSTSSKARGGSAKKSAANNATAAAGGGKKKQGSGKKNAVHALAVEPSEEGVSEISHVDVALTPVQTISIPAPAAGNTEGAQNTGVDRQEDGEGNLETEISPAEGHGGAAP